MPNKHLIPKDRLPTKFLPRYTPLSTPADQSPAFDNSYHWTVTHIVKVQKSAAFSWIKSPKMT